MSKLAVCFLNNLSEKLLTFNSMQQKHHGIRFNQRLEQTCAISAQTDPVSRADNNWWVFCVCVCSSQGYWHRRVGYQIWKHFSGKHDTAWSDQVSSKPSHAKNKPLLISLSEMNAKNINRTKSTRWASNVYVRMYGRTAEFFASSVWIH